MYQEEVNKEKIKQEKTNHFPCPSCGGNMIFNPETQTLLCQYCENKIEISKITGEIHEYDLNSAEETAPRNWGSEKRVMKCENCGAETILDADLTAQFCAFCGSSHVVKTEELAGIRPESVIPFKISRDKATEKFKRWVKTRIFAPNALRREHQDDRLVGMYIPYWTYDADTYSTYAGEAGEYYNDIEVVRVVENGKEKLVTRTVRKIRWHYTSGTYGEKFDDVLINASAQLDEKLIQHLEPFNLQQLEHYQPQYLSGFLAKRYNIGVKLGWEKAKNVIKEQIKHGIIHDINADEVRNLKVQTSFDQIKFKHILLPIWISSYTYRAKIYHYMVNGQTGEVQGETPVSPWKIAMMVLAALALFGAMYYWYNYL